MNTDLDRLPATHLAPEQAQTASIVLDSLAPATRRAYRTALAAIRDWHRGQEPTDATLQAYLTARFEAGASPATLRLTLAALRWLAEATESPSPVGRRTNAAMKRLSEAGADRGRGQASPLTYEEAIKVLTTADNPLDGAIVALLFMAGLRRSEAAALEWRDVEDNGDGTLLIYVRTSKTNRDGSEQDVRLVKNGFADAICELRPDDAQPTDKVLGGRNGRTVCRRFANAAKTAGIKRRLSAHSGRVGLASELTALGASETEVMLAGNWKTSRMVAHYSAGARAERGAVAKYFGNRSQA